MTDTASFTSSIAAVPRGRSALLYSDPGDSSSGGSSSCVFLNHAHTTTVRQHHQEVEGSEEEEEGRRQLNNNSSISNHHYHIRSYQKRQEEQEVLKSGVRCAEEVQEEKGLTEKNCEPQQHQQANEEEANNIVEDEGEGGEDMSPEENTIEVNPLQVVEGGRLVVLNGEEDQHRQAQSTGNSREGSSTDLSATSPLIPSPASPTSAASAQAGTTAKKTSVGHGFPTMEFEVVKTHHNRSWLKQKRLLILAGNEIWNARPREKAGQPLNITKVHTLSQVTLIALKSKRSFMLRFAGDHDYYYSSPEHALEIVWEVNRRRGVLRAVEKLCPANASLEEREKLLKAFVDGELEVPRSDRNEGDALEKKIALIRAIKAGAVDNTKSIFRLGDKLAGLSGGSLGLGASSLSPQQRNTSGSDGDDSDEESYQLPWLSVAREEVDILRDDLVNQIMTRERSIVSTLVGKWRNKDLPSFENDMDATVCAEEALQILAVSPFYGRLWENFIESNPGGLLEQQIRFEFNRRHLGRQNIETFGLRKDFEEFPLTLALDHLNALMFNRNPCDMMNIVTMVSKSLLVSFQASNSRSNFSMVGRSGNDGDDDGTSSAPSPMSTATSRSTKRAGKHEEVEIHEGEGGGSSKVKNLNLSVAADDMLPLIVYVICKAPSHDRYLPFLILRRWIEELGDPNECTERAYYFTMFSSAIEYILAGGGCAEGRDSCPPDGDDGGSDSFGSKSSASAGEGDAPSGSPSSPHPMPVMDEFNAPALPVNLKNRKFVTLQSGRGESRDRAPSPSSSTRPTSVASPPPAQASASVATSVTPPLRIGAVTNDLGDGGHEAVVVTAVLKSSLSSAPTLVPLSPTELSQVSDDPEEDDSDYPDLPPVAVSNSTLLSQDPAFSPTPAAMGRARSVSALPPFLKRGGGGGGPGRKSTTTATVARKDHDSSDDGDGVVGLEVNGEADSPGEVKEDAAQSTISNEPTTQQHLKVVVPGVEGGEGDRDGPPLPLPSVVDLSSPTTDYTMEEHTHDYSATSDASEVDLDTGDLEDDLSSPHLSSTTSVPLQRADSIMISRADSIMIKKGTRAVVVLSSRSLASDEGSFLISEGSRDE